MKIEQSLKLRGQARSRLIDLYSKAQSFKMTSAAINRESREIHESLGKAPQWVREYLRGAESVLRDNLYREHLEFCSQVPGAEGLVSHHRDSSRYYEKLGYSPEEICKAGMPSGHYWKGTDKPFFTS